jgi:hypothetical protein
MKIKSVALLLALLIGSAVMAQALEVPCPFDGESARFTGKTKQEYGHRTCEYTHIKLNSNIRHTFWNVCD